MRGRREGERRGKEGRREVRGRNKKEKAYILTSRWCPDLRHVDADFVDLTDAGVAHLTLGCPKIVRLSLRYYL